MKEKKVDCHCSCSELMVMACSGASDVGHLSDLVARKLRDNKIQNYSYIRY